MKLSRISALLTAGALTFSLLSCTDNNVPRQSRVRNSEREFAIGHPTDEEPIFDTDIDCPDLDEVQASVQQLLDDLDSKDSNAVNDDIDQLLGLYDEIYEAFAYKEMSFYANYSDNDMEEEYNEYYRDLYVAGDMIRFGFIRGFYSSFRSRFEELVSKEDIKLYSDITDLFSLDTARSDSEASFDEMSEYLGEYYDIIADDSLSDDEKDLECAEILIDILRDYDEKTLYSQYDRDYTGNELLALGESITDELIPVMDDLIDLYVDNYAWDDDSVGRSYADVPFETIREYAPMLSEDIAASADLICDERLYRICDNNDAFEGAFTEELPVDNKAMIFIGNVGADEILPTAIHEFGHFHASFYDRTPTFLSRNNLDIAEVQSQGLELIFTRFYDDIYGDTSDTEKLMQVIDLLDSVISGYLIGEFEYRAVQDIDNMTPEKLVELFNDTLSYYDGACSLYMISHLFESPGYYISYSTSALAAFDLFDDVNNDPDKALERYEKIAKISCNSGEYKFRRALSECGFSNVLTKDYISNLADDINDFIAQYK